MVPYAKAAMTVLVSPRSLSQLQNGPKSPIWLKTRRLASASGADLGTLHQISIIPNNDT